MAYLRKEKEYIEIDYPLEKVWEAISKVTENLKWQIEEKNESNYYIKLKTKAGFMAYSSTFILNLLRIDEKTTRLNLSAETPVTTITSIIDFGKTRERIEQFLSVLVEKLKE